MDPFISAHEQHEIALQQQQQRTLAHDVPAAATTSPQQPQRQIPSHSPQASSSLLPPAATAALSTASPSSGSQAAASTPLSATSNASLTSASGMLPSAGSAGGVGGVVVHTSPASRVASLKSAAIVWRSIGLDSLRSVIDASALSMASEEDRAVSARKALASQTKAFRALPDVTQVSQVGPMVKAYQSEVNELTRRSKAAEAAFLQLYRLLLDAPDPFPLLSDAALGLEVLASTEDALTKTRATLADCEAEFTGLKNQEVSIRKLEAEKRELESNLAGLVARGVEERSRANEEEMAATKRAYEEREQMLQSKLDAFREQLSASLSASNHMASLAAARDRAEAEQIESASRSDRKFFEAELERAHAEVAALTKEISALRASSQQQHHGAQDDTTHRSAEVVALLADRARLEEELATLQSKLDAAESTSQATAAKLESASRELATLRADSQASEEKLRAQLETLKAELAAAPSLAEFQELRRNLAAMQEIQFSSRREDEQEQELTAATASPASASPASGSGSGSAGSSASASATAAAAATPSQVLLAKTRRLESELTSLKLSHSALESAQAKSASEAESLRAQLVQARESLAKVEHDLAESSALVSEGMFKASIASAMGTAATAAAAVVAMRAPNTAAVATALPMAEFSRPTPAAAAVASLHMRTPTPVASTVPSDPAFASLSVDIPDASPMPPSSSSVGSAAAVASAVPLLASLQAQLAQSTSMLRIVLAQRDRYRSQLETIEADRAAATGELERARTEATTLRKENLQLYEKLQFVKSLSNAGSNAAAGSSSSSSASADRKLALSGASSAAGDIESGFGGIGSGALSRGGAGAAGGAGDSEAKYKLLYDEKLNPFAAFKARARAEREKALSQSERVTLAVGRALFSKKSARTALFAYALVLHLLVMVVLWTHTVSSHCGNDKGGLGEHQH